MERFHEILNFHFFQKITNYTPPRECDIINISILIYLEIADSNFYVPDQVDALIDSELFFHILKGKEIHVANGKYILQNSEFRYLVTGSLP